ncbi:MAG: vWA domain-containing protein [Pirellulales bacterium]
MFDQARRWWQEYTGEDETPLDGDTPAWVVSLGLHVAVLLVLAVAGLGVMPRSVTQVTVIETPVDEPDVLLDAPVEVLVVDQEPDAGALSDQSLDVAQSLAPVLALESIVPILSDEVMESEIQVEVVDALPTGKQLNDSLVVKGDVGVGETGAGGAVDRLTLEIIASLEQRPTVVCWVFDQSLSLAAQRKEIAARLARVFDELGVSATARSNELFNLVYAYGQQVTPVVSVPTQNVGDVVSAINSIPIDGSGVEMTFTAVAEAAKKAKQVRLTASQRNVMIIVFTDEVGDDQQHADLVATYCARQQMRVFVVGVPAPFGKRHVRMKFVEFDPQFADDEQWAEVEQGPESRYPEVVTVRPKNRPDEPIDSGYGPFSLSKLCAETGGMYFAVHANRGVGGRVTDSATAPMSSGLRYFFDPNVMRDYRPDYLSQAEVDRLLAVNRAKRALVDAARAAEVAPMEAPATTFPREDDGRLVNLLSEAQKKAAVLQPKIDALHGLLAAGLPDRDKIEEKRWQAGYDLALGRVLALKVRTDAYNILLAQAKSGMKFKDPKNDTWVLEPSVDVSKVGSQTERLAKQADELLQRVVADHAGTPWAQMAAEELKSPLGYSWEETYTGVNAPRAGNGGNGNPNQVDDMRRNLVPPKPKRDLKKI